MKKLIAIGSSVAMIVSSLAFLVPVTSAAAFFVGNDTAARTQVDTFSNFTIIDTNHPAGMTGELTSFGYYASNTNPFRFVVVDGVNVVKWISPQITPAGVGVHTFIPGSPVQVNVGWNVGLYFVSTGTIPFEFSGASAMYTANNSGLPTVGIALSFVGSSSRTYSFVASGKTEEGENENGNGIIGSASGSVRYTANGLARRATFVALDKSKDGSDKGKGFFFYRDANGDWYRVKIQLVAVDGKDAFFAGPVVKASQTSWVGQWLYAKVHDGGSPGKNGDMIWGTFTDEASAKAHFSGNNLTNPSGGAFAVAGGNLVVHQISADED